MTNGHHREPIESVAILDITATEIHHVEDLGHGLRRLVFTTPHPLPSGQIERHVTVKLIVPAACLTAMAFAMNDAAVEAIQGVLSLVQKNQGASGN